jgi:predicted transcriptional regulator
MKGAKIMDKNVIDESRLIELYESGMKASDIGNELGISRSQVYNYLRKHDVTWRYPSKAVPRTNTYVKKTKKTKKCPVCKAVNNPKEAKFCCMCGADIRNKADIILEKLNKSYSICCDLLPASSNQEVRDTLMEAIKYIEETNK